MTNDKRTKHDNTMTHQIDKGVLFLTPAWVKSCSGVLVAEAAATCLNRVRLKMDIP